MSDSGTTVFIRTIVQFYCHRASCFQVNIPKMALPSLLQTSARPMNLNCYSLLLISFVPEFSQPEKHIVLISLMLLAFPILSA